MKPDIAATAATAATESRPNRLLVALAAIWLVVSIVFGGMATSDLRADSAPAAGAGDTTSRP